MNVSLIIMDCVPFPDDIFSAESDDATERLVTTLPQTQLKRANVYTYMYIGQGTTAAQSKYIYKFYIDARNIS